MPLGDYRKILDAAHLEATGMTAKQQLANANKIASENAQIEQNLQTWTPGSSPVNIPTRTSEKLQGMDFMPFVNKSDDAEIPELERASSKLRFEDKIANLVGATVQQKTRTPERIGGKSFFDIGDPDKIQPLSLDKSLTYSPEVLTTTSSLSNKLLEGDLNALTELKKNLQESTSWLGINNKASEELNQAYSEVAGEVQNINRFKLAKSNLEGHLESLSKQNRAEFLKNTERQGFQVSNSLLAPNQSPDQLNNALLAIESFKIGSPVYNEDRLKEFKIRGTYVNTENKENSLDLVLEGFENFNAQKDLSYNYAMNAAIKSKQNEVKNRIEDVDKKISTTTDAQIKDQLIAEKVKLTDDAAYLKQLDSKVSVETSPDIFLKKYYPLAYEKQKKIDHREVVQGSNIAKANGDPEAYLGWLGKAKFHMYRSAQEVGNNFVNTLSGVASLVGSNNVAASTDLWTRANTPPSYRQGVDIDGNDKLDQLELTVGKDGQPIVYTDAIYKNKDGNSVWNMWSMVEQTAPIVADIAIQLLATRGAGAAARGAGLTYAKLGGDALVKMAPRISTFSSVFMTTFPRMYAQEINNFKDSGDALAVSTLRAVAEAATESVVPQTELFKTGRTYGPLDPMFKKLGDAMPFSFDVLSKKADVLLSLLPENAVSKTTAALALLPTQARKIASEAFQEGFVEEELSLLGNYFVDKYAKSLNFESPEANELTLDNVVETGLTGFIPSLLIAGGNEAVTGNIKKERLDQARWNMANNPATYKDLITKQVNSGSLSKEKGIQRMALVDSLNRRLESMAEMSNIKNLTTLLDDKEAQRQYFQNILAQEDLLKVNRLELNADQQKTYDTLLERTNKELDYTRKNIEKYTSLSNSEKQNIVSKVFNRHAASLENPDTTLAEVLHAATYANRQINNFKSSDKNFEFVQQQYEKYRAKAEEILGEKISYFEDLLDNNPEEITNLELVLARTSFLPLLAELNSNKVPYNQTSVEGPKENLGLFEKIDLELKSRLSLTPDEYTEQAVKNFNNPETKRLQRQQLTLAELSPEELESGQLTEGAHTHLTDGDRLSMAAALENHLEEKQQDPSKPTSLETFLETVHANDYGVATNNLTPEQKTKTIRDLNKHILEAYNSQESKTPISSFNPNQPANLVKNTDFVEPTADAQDIIEYLGLDPENTFPINVLVYTDVNAKNRVIDEIEEPQDKANDRIALFETVLAQEDPLDIYSGLLAMYPEQAKNIEQFFATYEDSPNTNLLPFLTKSQVSQLTEVLNEKIKPEEAPRETVSEADAKKDNIEKRRQELTTFTSKRTFIKGVAHEIQIAKKFNHEGFDVDVSNKADTSTGFLYSNVLSEHFDTLEEAIEYANQIIQGDKEYIKKVDAELAALENQVNPIEEISQATFEDEVTDGIIKDQELLSQIEQVPVTPRDLSLNIVSLNSANVPLTDDARTAFAVNVVNAFDNLREKLPAVKLRIQGAMETYAYVLSSAKFEALKTLKNKAALTPEDIATLKSILSLNGVPFHENSFIQYLIDNPSAIGTGVLSVLTDEEGKVMLFEKNGVPSQVGTPLISTFKVSTLKGQLKNLVDQIKANPETVATANITGTVPGTDLVPINLSSVKNKTNYSLRVIDSPTPDTTGMYTLYPGRTYIINSNNFFKPATAVTLPKADGQLVFKLVEAFNNGTLPNGLPESVEDFLSYLRTYQLTSFKSEKAVYILDKNKAGDKIVFKKKNVAGKWQTVSTITPKVQQAIVESFNDAYKNIVADRLNSTTNYYPTRLNAKGEIELLPATTYRDFVMSPEFGATFREEGNRTLGFDTPQINAPSSSEVTVSEVLENIPSQETPITEAENIPTPIPTEKVPQENIPEVTTEQPVKKRKSIAELNQATEVEQINDSQLKRSRLLESKITAKQKAKAKAWVENHPIFKNTSFIFDQTINHPEAYAVWSKAGIQLFNGANWAEAYHESWHEFTQLYLTPEQKQALYKEASKIYGNLIPFELEEKMAEDFRLFALSDGKVFPEAIKKSQETKNTFEKIWNFITNLFSNKKTVDFYFKQLYKGNIASYKRSEDNIRFTELFSRKLSILSNEELKTFSFVESDKIVKQFDSLFTHVANQITKSVNGSFVNVAVSKEVIPKVYVGIKGIIAQTYKELLVLEEAGDTTVESKLDYLDDLLDNFDTVSQFHIQNSLIFDDKVKRSIQLEVLEEEQDANTELGSFDKSVNEISQKELASNLIISAIRTLPKHTKGNINPEVDYIFGVPQLGDFDTNWNILRRTLAGLTTYEQMYNKLKELTKDYPQFNSLINYLPASIERFSSLSFKNEFFNLFTMPYMEGYTTKINKDEAGNVTDVKVQKSSSLDAVRLKNLYDGEFGMTQGLYKVINPNTGLQELDVDAYFTNNPSLPTGLGVLATDEEKRARLSQLINLLRPLGFNLSQAAVDSIPLEDMVVLERNVNLIRTKLQSLGGNGTVGNPLNQLSSPHKVDKAVIKSENSAVNYFLNLEVKANPEYIDDMRMNAEGSRVWSVNQHTFMSRVASALNDYETYPTAKDVYKAFPQLDPEYNSNTIGSFVLEYLFDKEGNRITDSYNGGKATYRQVELANLEGIKIEEEGEKTINTNYIDKHFAEVNSFLQSGVEEINRLSGKSTTRSFVLDLGLRKFLGMDKPASKDGQGNIRLFEPQMRLLFKAIMSEIKMTKEIEDKIANKQKVYIHPKVSIRDSKGSPKLGYFEDILSSEQRTKLYNEFKDKDVTDENGENILNKLFEEAVEKYPIVIEIAKNFNIYFNGQVDVSLGYFKAKNLDTIQPVDLFKYHFYSFLSRLEQHKLFYGHPYYYKNAKDIEKRLSAWNAFGSYTMLDPANTAFLQNKVFTQRGSFIKYAEQNNILINEQKNDLSKVNYIVLKDRPVVSKTAFENKEAYGESLDAYTNDDKTKTQDAAAFMTVDFFKRFYALSTGITPEMDQEIGRQNRIYQAILDNDQETLSKELNTKASYKFTIKKLQYAGFAKGVNNEGVPVFHKYSVKPILPSEAVNDPELLAILHKLHASSADYAVFESGTKIGETIAPVSLFKNGKVDTTNVPIGQIEIKHLKEQVLIENKESFESVFSTQFRSLLYKDAEDAEVLKLYEAYKSYVKEIVDYDKINYLENLNDKDKLVNFLLKELEKKNASEATKDLIKLKTDGSLMYMLDSMVDRTVMESAIVSSAKRKIIRQKLNGAQRVQYPVSLVRPERTLNYYSLTKDGKTINKAEVIVSFSKGYYPLLNLMYDGSPIGELDANGEPTNPFDALLVLNEALKNPAFVKANEKALSMVAIRIPGQGYNSMENFTVVEFLPEESGEIILVPDEMVVKSGSDYDIDKLFCYDPYIKEDGTVPLTTQTAQQSFDRKKKLTEDYKVLSSVINETREFKNSLIAQLEEILTKYGVDKNKKLKEVYSELRELKSQLSNEVAEEELSVDALQKLKDYFSKEVTVQESEQQKQVAEEVKKIREQVKNLQEVLKETSGTNISRDLYLVSEVFKKLYADKNAVKNELDGLRKTHANNLIFNVVDRLSQSDIFDSLITPNSSDIIKGLAKEFGTIEPNTSATYTSILSPIYQLYVFNLNTYKKSLGVGAKINTFHSLVQKAKLNLENKSANRLYILPSNRIDGKVYYSSIYDVDGNLISLLNGQMISAHVDIEKEDEVARIYFNNLITPVVLYTAIAGTPISTVTRLINQKYKNEPTDEKSQRSSIVRYGLGTPAQDILKEMMSNPDIAKLIKVGANGVNVKKTVAQALNLLTSKTTDLKAIQDFLLTEETPLADFYRFMQFMEFEAQQKQLSTLSLNTDYHTFSPQNFESFRRGAEDLRQLRKEEYFNRSGVDYMISETEISPFQIQADILDKFVEVMPISANRKLTDIILTIHAGLNKKGSKVDYEKFSRTFKNDLLYALFVNRVPESQEYEQYLIKTNESNVVNMHNSLKSRLEKRGIDSNNVIFDMFKQNTNNESAYIRTGLLLSSVDYSINVYKEAFEEGLSWTNSTLNLESEEDMQLVEDMQKFFKVFAYAGILGTQLNKKIDSYLPLIPESIYTYSMSQVVNEFKNELDTVSAKLLEEVRNTLATKPTTQEEDVEDALNTKLLSSSDFLGQFINRFQEVHPEFYKVFKNVNPDLAFFKDYRLDQENTTPTKKKTIKENVPTTESKVSQLAPTTPKIIQPVVESSSKIKNIIYKSGLEPGQYEVLSINGVEEFINLTQMPKTVKNGYNVFYSNYAISLAKRVGKKIIVPGFEDLKLVIEQNTGEIFELSTGFAISTESRSLANKIIELEKLFKEKDIRSVIAKSKKIDANQENAVITVLETSENASLETEVSIPSILADPFKSVEEINREQENNCISPKN